MSGNSHDHLIEISEDQRVLTIYRVGGGNKQLFTSVTMPPLAVDRDPDGFREFCRLLGENVLLDSPAARRLFRI